MGQKSSKKKLSTENWLAVGNLILTIITGIVITLYLQYQNQRFQEQLIQIQIEQERISNTAFISVVPICDAGGFCSGLGGIQVTNTGKATAENLRIAIFVDRVNYYWKKQITGIDKFNFSVTDASLPYQIEITNTAYRPTNGYPQQLEDDNTLIMTIASLPPGEQIGLVFSLGNDVAQKGEIAIQAMLVVPNSLTSSLQETLPSPMAAYLEDVGISALLVYEMSCSNCRYTDKADTFVVRSFVGMGSLEIGKPTPRDANTSLVEVNMTPSYWFTEESKGDLPSNLLLQLVDDGNGNYSIIQMPQ